MDSIKKLINLFSDFPTVGQRTAGRFVYYLMRQPKNKVDELTNAILELKNKIKFCAFCFNPHEAESPICPICQNINRNKNLLCIVEKETDLNTIENTGKFSGLYFVLGGTLSSLRNSEIENLKLESLRQRIINPEKFLNVTKSANKSEGFQEIIIATNPTPEGISTSALIERALKEISQSPAFADKPVFKVTHLARGIPVGGELEYADEETLESAFEGRK